MASQEQRKAETRQRLLDAAALLFAERGIEAVSIDTVAEAADRTSGAVYAHFGGKDGLLNALLENLINERSPSSPDTRFTSRAIIRCRPTRCGMSASRSRW